MPAMNKKEKSANERKYTQIKEESICHYLYSFAEIIFFKKFQAWFVPAFC
ncbi:MAG: hypothetical protein QG652_550 [Pseudomonadota bacterium]|nr:hypothetical protein [Pseudomonadota bacterium]